MKQYENGVPNEYVIDLIKELSLLLDIEIDLKEYMDKADNDGSPGPHCVCTFSKGREFIMIDVRNIDILNAVVVRCEDVNSDKVKEVVLKWDILARTKYHQIIMYDLEDSYQKNNTLFEGIIKIHGINV